jgi:hypothetical protein
MLHDEKPKVEPKEYKCELCNITFNKMIVSPKIYHIDDRLTIIECTECHDPICIYKYHGSDFEERDIAKIHFFANDWKWFNKAEVDWRMSEWKGHTYCHFRNSKFGEKK